MTVVSEIRLLDFFKSKFKLNEEEAREAVTEVTTYNEKLDKEIIVKIDEKFINLKDVFLTKDDKVDIIQTVAHEKVEIIQKIADSKTSTILWMFVFWIGQVAVIAEILTYLLKK